MGIASYSSGEMRLLDEIDAALEVANGTAPVVSVFDVLDCNEMSDFGRFITGIRSVYETPIIGVAMDGQIIEQATGLANVEKLLQRFNVPNSGERSIPSAIG